MKEESAFTRFFGSLASLALQFAAFVLVMNALRLFTHSFVGRVAVWLGAVVLGWYGQMLFEPGTLGAPKTIWKIAFYLTVVFLVAFYVWKCVAMDVEHEEHDEHTLPCDAGFYPIANTVHFCNLVPVFFLIGYLGTMAFEGHGVDTFRSMRITQAP